VADRTSNPRSMLERAYDRIEQLERELEQVRRVTDELQAQHRREVTKLKADLDAAVADKQTYEGRWAKASTAIQSIVNNPLMPRDQVQSRLLVFTQSN
jgi:multidrug resistance efflux pump